MTWLDLNADIGEGIGGDAELLTLVSSASIACGAHAGDRDSMRKAADGALRHRVRIGAHPGFADREHFGRRRLELAPTDLTALVLAQLGELQAVTAEAGARIAYVKLHGALANMAAEDAAVATACFEAVRSVDPDLAILAIDNSAQVEAGTRLGLPVIREAYADRAYLATGLLAPRSEPGAVLHDPEEISGRVVRLARHGEILAIDGSVIRTSARSVCIHGDTPAAVEIARAVRQALDAAGVTVRAGN